MARKKKQEAEEVEEQATEKVKMPMQNGITRPKPNTATGRVWEIADELTEALGDTAPRGDVLKAYVDEGGNPATGATQYGRWRKFNGLGRYKEPVA